MSLTETQQLEKLFANSKHILLVFGSVNHSDAIASSLALKAYLEKKSKQVDIAASSFVAPKNLRFLAGLEGIKSELAQLKKFIIKVDVSKARLETLSYDIKDNWLSIYLTPKHGQITKNELRTAQSTFKYDLIITLNTPDLESLGEIFLNNTDLFFGTPIINIDCHPANEHYGQLNLIDLTATSAAEIIFQTLEQLNEIIEAPVATALLTGLIAATKSFKTPNVTPRTLNLASKLIKLGGERETIVQHLYRTRSLTTLKLWGQALTHLKSDGSLGLVWTTIAREDFSRSGATAEDLKGVADELISNSPEAKIILLLFELDRPENANQVHGLISADMGSSALELVQSFAPTGNKKQASFIINGKTLGEAEAVVIGAIKQRPPISA